MPCDNFSGIRVKHYTRKTEQAHGYWIRKYILFHNKRHPKEMGTSEVQAFLKHLAIEHILASTQNQALSALLFLYRNVLSLEIGSVDSVPAYRVSSYPTSLFVSADAVITEVVYGSMSASALEQRLEGILP